MAAYKVLISSAASRALEALDRPMLRRLDAAILAIAEQPRPPGARKLTGEEDLYRVRVGDYRIVYQIKDQVLMVLVVAVGHRREVYRGR